MPKFKFLALVAGIGLIFWGAPVSAETGHGEHAHDTEMQKEEARIVGEVIDVVCYVRMDARGEKHIKCAEYCAQLGIPLGILEEKTGQIYLVFPEGHGNPNEKAVPFIGKKVEVVGKINTKGGLKGITVKKISEVKG